MLTVVMWKFRNNEAEGALVLMENKEHTIVRFRAVCGGNCSLSTL